LNTIRVHAQSAHHYFQLKHIYKYVLQAQPADAVNGNVAGKSPPQFSQMPQSAYVNAGEKASFTAKASGQPVPSLEWSRNGKALSDPKKYQISGKDGQSQLTINQITDADYGTYVCTASNPSGRFQAQFQIANARKFRFWACFRQIFMSQRITHFADASNWPRAVASGLIVYFRPIRSSFSNKKNPIKLA
jgi:hypothetical protein